MVPPDKASLEQSGLVLHSSDILGNSKMVLIRHQDQWYRLMVTRQGKLILTK